MNPLFVSTFITLFVVIDPVGCAPIFAGLIRGASTRETLSAALRATCIATLILLAFAFFGPQFLELQHIELDSFRIAGGLMLFLIALDMVFDKRTQRREERNEKLTNPDATPVPQTPKEDIAVFPMAMPMIAGPGSIAAVMLAMAKAHAMQAQAAVIGALLAVMVLTLAALAAAGPLMKLLGTRVEGVITRVLGVLLGALAVQYVVDGLRGVVGL
jgi:multiple antibiotic resistance protein